MKSTFVNHKCDKDASLADRREFLKHCVALAGIGISGCVVVSGPRAYAEIVAENDPRLETGRIRYPVEGGEMKAYMARPKGSDKLPAIIVIHEIYGLNPHIEDVARRIALEGFLVIAPDALSPLGGTPDDTKEALGKMRQLDGATTVGRVLSSLESDPARLQAMVVNLIKAIDES